MHSKTVLAMAMLAIVSGCGAAEPSSNEEPDHAAQQADVSFTVLLDPTTTEKDITLQIVAAGHSQIAAMCEAEPWASVRIVSPFASETYEDISCASVLDGDEPAGEASAALVIDENDGAIGTAQQRLSPFTVACGVFVGVAFLFATYALCPRAKTPRDEKNCGYVTNGGLTGMGIACAFM